MASFPYYQDSGLWIILHYWIPAAVVVTIFCSVINWLDKRS